MPAHHHRRKRGVDEAAARILMEPINTVLILLLLVTVAITVIAFVTVSSRRRQVQSAADEARRKAAEERQRREVEQEAARRAEEEERRRVEAECRRLEEDLRRAQEERRKAEEECKRLDEEARREIEKAQRKAEVQRQTEELRKAEEEQRRREADEAQRKAEELQVAEEEYRRSEEEGKRLEEETRHKEEEAQRKAEDETRSRAEEEARQRAKEDKERRQIPLNHRPPRRQPRPQEPSEKRSPQETKQRRPKPEIVCWKRERQWIPAVEVPEELFESPNLAVLQNGLPLTQDESRKGCGRLEEAYGQVVVQWNEDEVAREIKIALGEESYLLFKLSGQNQNQGCRVKSPSSGSYLVMVPDNWERDEALSGPPPIVPEPVSLTGYQAHFYILEKDGDGKIAFHTPAGESFVIESKAPQFELVGTRLNDASEDMGPLFGERPPQIRALDDQAWRDIGTIIVGEEGSGKGRWRMAFSPVQDLLEQNLPSEVAAGTVGWYFLRFYDTNDDLMESLDFRFLCGLREIRILQSFPLPSETGHKPARVEFLHEPGCAVLSADGLACSIEIEREDDKTILSIPPDPTCDETRWLVGYKGGPQVEVTVLVERLWWAVGKEHNAPSEWEDQLLTLPRNNFAATSAKALWLRLPRRRWVDVVSVGFERSKARQFSMKVTEKMFTIPLREFGDSTEVGDREQEHFLKVWIERADSLVEGVIAIIPVKQSTRIEQESPLSEAKEVCEKRALLNPSMISAPRLATVLTSLGKVTSGPLLVLIKEARKGYPRAHAARRAGSVEFAKNALCVIAMALELRGEEQSRILSLKIHWRIKAGLARDEFPEIINRVRKRYKDINVSGARRAGNMYDKRYAE